MLLQIYKNALLGGMMKHQQGSQAVLCSAVALQGGWLVLRCGGHTARLEGTPAATIFTTPMPADPAPTHTMRCLAMSAGLQPSTRRAP